MPRKYTPRQPRETRQCLTCGAPFSVKAANIRDRNPQFCSLRCSGLHHRRRVDRLCKHCGAKFFAYEFMVAKGIGLFCTKSCYDLSRAKTEKPCEQCGANFFPQPGKPGRFCSQRCNGDAKIAGRTIRFWSFVNRNGPSACWTWDGARNRKGYGNTVAIFGTHTSDASRVAWEVATGKPVPAGFHVCHDCPGGDNPACVRNDEPGFYEINGVLRPRLGHLWLGTPAENSADMKSKGRAKYWGHPS